MGTRNGGSLNKRLVGVAIAGQGAAQTRRKNHYRGPYSWIVAKRTDESAQEVMGRVQEHW